MRSSVLTADHHGCRHGKGVTVAERVSEREAEVLAALGARLSNAQIANRLHISVRTVESHVSSLLRKYGVADRWALAELARSDPAVLAGALEVEAMNWWCRPGTMTAPGRAFTIPDPA